MEVKGAIIYYFDLGVGLKSYAKVCLCDGQDPVRQAILYVDKACLLYCSDQKLMYHTLV